MQCSRPAGIVSQTPPGDQVGLLFQTNQASERLFQLGSFPGKDFFYFRSLVSRAPSQDTLERLGN